MNIISLILSVFMLYVLYYIFEHYEFKIGLIINCIYYIIATIINNGVNILAILLGIIVTVIETYIAYRIYKKSNTFWEFFGKILLIGLIIVVIVFLLAFIGTRMVMRNSIINKQDITNRMQGIEAQEQQTANSIEKGLDKIILNNIDYKK